MWTANHSCGDIRVHTPQEQPWSSSGALCGRSGLLGWMNASASPYLLVYIVPLGELGPAVFLGACIPFHSLALIARFWSTTALRLRAGGGHIIPLSPAKDLQSLPAHKILQPAPHIYTAIATRHRHPAVLLKLVEHPPASAHHSQRYHHAPLAFLLLIELCDHTPLRCICQLSRTLDPPSRSPAYHEAVEIRYREKMDFTVWASVWLIA